MPSAPLLMPQTSPPLRALERSLRHGARALCWEHPRLRNESLADSLAQACPHASVERLPLGQSPRSSASPLFDLVVINGSCSPEDVREGVSLLKPDGEIALLGPPDPRLDGVKATLREHGHVGSWEAAEIGSGRAFHLWYGGTGVLPELARPAPGGDRPLPTVVNFYTRNTPYEREVQGLIESCAKIGWPCEAVGVESRGSWEFNCAYKARFVREMWGASGGRRPVVWLDADAIVGRSPTLFERWADANEAPDFAIYKLGGWMFASGTLFFGATALAGELLDRWVELCEIDPRQWDQVHLGNAWEDIVSSRPLHTVWLPQSYCKIADWPDEDGTTREPVFEHFCAARRFQQAVSGGARSGSRGVFKSLQSPHAASRPAEIAPPRVLSHLADLAEIVAAINPATAIEITHAPPVLEGITRAAKETPTGVRVLPSSSSLSLGDETADLIVARDILEGLGDAEATALVEQLRARARLGLVVGVSVSHPGVLRLVESWRPHRQRLHATTTARAWMLAAWAHCDLPELESFVAPRPAASEGTASASLESRVNELNASLINHRRYAEHLRQALLRSVARRCADMGWHRIALYGAGRHSETIIHEPWGSAGVRVVLILDDAPRAAALAGVPVRTPDAAGREFDAVVISSDYHEEAIARRAQARFDPLGIPVLGIYGKTFDFSTIKA